MKAGITSTQCGIILYVSYVPKGKKRTALLRKLEKIFRSFRSQSLNGLIETINPILRGWVK